MVYDLKLPLPIAGLIKPYEYFTVAWVIIFKVIFSMHACASNAGFC